LARSSVNTIVVGEKDLFVGTNFTVWKRPLSDFKIKTNKPVIYNLYPNPTNDILYLDCPSEAIGKNYQIIDVLGRIVLEDAVENVITPISVSVLASVTYFLHIVGTSTTIKFVKY